MFKIGIGPSSSHTLGPWRAAQRFAKSLLEKKGVPEPVNITVLLYGSLAKTGRGHGTDIAIQLGLSGDDPVSFDVNRIKEKVDQIRISKKLLIPGFNEIDFDPQIDIEFLYSESLPYHPNAVTFLGKFRNGE